MLTENIHFIVMGICRKVRDSLIEILIIYDMVASDKPRQVEGLARRIRRQDMLTGPFTDHLSRHMGMPGIGKIRPDLITDHKAVISAEDLHCLFDFLSCPDSPARIMRRTENCKPDLILTDLTLHVLIVHPPDPTLILLEIAEHRTPSLVDNISDKTYIIWPMKKNPVSGLCQHINHARDKSVHTIFISDMLPREPCHMIAFFLPADNRVIVTVLWHKISKQRMLRTPDDRVCNRRAGFEIHICHPHRDKIESLHRHSGLKSPDPLSSGVYRSGVLSPPVNNRRKIVLHSFSISIQNPVLPPLHTAAALFTVYHS